VTGRLVQASGREDYCGSVLREELLGDADSCAWTFEVDVYERDIGPLAA
jgi:hypothetical protein